MLLKKKRLPEKKTNPKQALLKQLVNTPAKARTCKVSYMQQVCKNYKNARDNHGKNACRSVPGKAGSRELPLELGEPFVPAAAQRKILN